MTLRNELENMIQNQLPHCVLSANRFGFGLRLKWVTIVRSPADLTGVSAASNLSRHSGISSSNCHIIYTNIQFTCGRFFHTTFFITLQSILYHCSYRLRHISGITCALWRHYEDRDTPTGSSDWREVWLSPGGVWLHPRLRTKLRPVLRGLSAILQVT